MKPSSQPTQKRILKLYEPHAGQLQGHNSTKRFNALCWGRQSGKSTYGLNKISKKAWEGPRDGIYWYLLQTHDAAMVAYDRMYRDFYVPNPQIFLDKPNGSNLSCRFRHGPKIVFKSGWAFESLRAETLNGAIIDEYREQDASLWPMIIRPMLGAKKGWADILSTPNGYDHFYDLVEHAKTNEEWGYFYNPSSIAPWWTPEELESVRKTSTPDQYAQEYLAEFREFGTGKVYLRHGTWNQSETNPFAPLGKKWSPYLPIVVGLDFNVGVMCWELGQNRADKFHFVEEIAIENTNTEIQTKVLIEKVKGHQAGVVLVGDSSGKAQKTSASGNTDYSIIMNALKQAEIRVENHTPESNPPVKDRINAFNSALKDGEEQVHLTYSPTNCPRLKKDLERVKWKKGTSNAMLDKSDSELTHASDAAGYPIFFYSNQFKTSPGVTRVIRR